MEAQVELKGLEWTQVPRFYAVPECRIVRIIARPPSPSPSVNVQARISALGIEGLHYGRVPGELLSGEKVDSCHRMQPPGGQE
jgi:hypothetical protein